MPMSRGLWGGAIACLILLTGGTAARAQVDIGGTWIHWTDQDNKIRGPGPDPDSFLGIPLNAAAQAASLAFSPQAIAEVHRQCAPWTITYVITGGFALNLYPTKRLDGSVLAWNIAPILDRDGTTIWMDGRPPPSPQAPHTLGGYTIGRWQGDTLVTTTTHIQDGYLTRNGAPNSDQEVFTMFLTRHDNVLNLTGIVDDPVYLSEPYILSDVLSYNAAGAAGPGGGDVACTPEEEEVNADKDRVPTFLTPPADSVAFEATNYGIPVQASIGGAQTMYPEYARIIQSKYKRPQGYCTIDCCGEKSAAGDGNAAMAFNVSVLKCKQSEP